MEKFVLIGAIVAAVIVGFALPTPGADAEMKAAAPSSQFAQLSLR